MLPLHVLDLFSGIGGFSLGLERTGGFKTVAFCEIDKKAQLVLRKHWPDTPIFNDVCALTGDLLNAAQLHVDVIAGGFPCQDISLAGKGAGLAGERSGLWAEFHRLIREIKPCYAPIENVSALRSRGLEDVLWSLFEIGYNAEWHCIPASAIGAPHRRDRIWIVAHPRHRGWRNVCPSKEQKNEERERSKNTDKVGGSSAKSAFAADALCQGLERQRALSGRIAQELKNTSYARWWNLEPAVGRVAHGISGRVDRLKQLGNAVVPQIPQLLGQAILDFERDMRAAT